MNQIEQIIEILNYLQLKKNKTTIVKSIDL